MESNRGCFISSILVILASMFIFVGCASATSDVTVPEIQESFGDAQKLAFAEPNQDYLVACDEDDYVTMLDGDECPNQPDPDRLSELEEWLGTRYANDFVRAGIHGRGTSRLEELQHSVRHIYEQDVLPMYVYDYELELIYALNTGNLEEIEMYITLFWNRLALHRIITDLVEEERIYVVGSLHAHVNRMITGFLGIEDAGLGMFDPFSGLVKYAPFCFDCEMYKFAPVMQTYGLYAPQHILDISIEEAAGGVRVALIRMYEPGWVLLSTYIGIVYIEDFGLQVFTLERSFGENDTLIYDEELGYQLVRGEGESLYMFSAVFVDSRRNFGEIENCKETFLDVISELVLSLN